MDKPADTGGSATQSSTAGGSHPRKLTRRELAIAKKLEMESSALSEVAADHAATRSSEVFDAVQGGASSVPHYNLAATSASTPFSTTFTLPQPGRCFVDVTQVLSLPWYSPALAPAQTDSSEITAGNLDFEFKLAQSEADLSSARSDIQAQSKANLHLEFKLSQTEAALDSSRSELHAQFQTSTALRAELAEALDEHDFACQQHEVDLERAQDRSEHLHVGELRANLESEEAQAQHSKRRAQVELRVVSHRLAGAETQLELFTLSERKLRAEHGMAEDSLQLAQLHLELARQQALSFEDQAAFEAKQHHFLHEQHELLELRFEHLHSECAKAASSLSNGDLFSA